MLDLGKSFVASVVRDPHALAVVDDGVRLTYAEWYRRISSVVAALDRIGLKAGDHVVTVLQNCEAAATLHWACQLAGIVITPVNWRANDGPTEPAGETPPRPLRLSNCRKQLDAPGISTATFEWAYRWLIAHQPPESPPVLVHGDYRMGNLLVDGCDLTAVLDWEWVHVGEASEDLAWSVHGPGDSTRRPASAPEAWAASRVSWMPTSRPAGPRWTGLVFTGGW